MSWDTSVPDWQDRIRKGKSLCPTLEIDKDEAERAVSIFNRLCLPDVPGQPLLAQAGGDWFRDIIANLFGSIERVDEYKYVRHIREVFLLAPKKSSKTSYSAGLMITALLMNRRPRAEFLLIAPTKSVAELAFSQAVGMISADPVLRKIFPSPQDHLKRITHERTKARLSIKAFDTRVLTGVKPAGVLIDELHEIAKDASAASVIGQLRGGMLPSPESFMVIISTQSDDPPSGVFGAELSRARKVRDGKATGSLLPIIYEFPDDLMASNGWRDPSTWWMVSPNRGKSMTVERLIPDWEAAQLAGEHEIRRWASQHLNVQIGLGLRTDAWAGAQFWQDCTDARLLDLGELIRRSEVAVVGADGGGLDDLFGLCVMGREKETRRKLVWSHAWAHRIVLERRKEIAPRLQDFANAGLLTIVPDNSADDIREAVDLVERISDAGILAEGRAIGVDPVGITQFIDELEFRGFSADTRIHGVRQGWPLTDKIKSVERELAAKSLRHGGSPMMAWCVGNAKVEPRGSAVTITKQVSGSAKIDPLIALFNAADIMANNPQPPKKNVYEERAERGSPVLRIA